ncbi:hypothetical protein GH714_014926 [Hevea brasiliensis]|uniref:Reverse transcriptase Ty1/copia-type domain-containing protein n=1 Tax=Hevea brasiliensis TaxID=3981 RepID=A0A6A6L7Q5_HEVBR|nr:hypothetical protein GH714_014926 [Hevea brasiliensis]
MFAKLFSKKNDTRSQLIESELLSLAQCDMTIAQYFHKVKSLCQEILELDPQAPIGETRMKRIIIHGLRLEYRRFIAAVQGWQNQPSLVEFENLLAGQEALVKQMGEVLQKVKRRPFMKGALQAVCHRWLKRNQGKAKNHQGEGCTSSGELQRTKVTARCLKGNATTAARKVIQQRCVGRREEPWKVMPLLLKSEEEWDVEALFAAEDDEIAPMATTSNLIDYEKYWIVDSGCLNHMTDVKVYHDLEIIKEPVMKGWRLESVYVMTVETTYVDKTTKNETADLWHMWLGDINYSKLDLMMKRSMLKGLSQLEIKLSEAEDADNGDIEEGIAQNPCTLMCFNNQMKKWLFDDTANSSLFVKANGGKLAIVLMYVDGLIIIGDCEEEVLRSKENLSVRFQMKELGQLKHFLSLEVDRTEEGIFFHQQKNSKDLLKKFGLLKCKTISMPIEPNAKMCAHEGKDLEDTTMYRQVVGSLSS